MNDQPDKPAETPMQRALRMKKAAQEARRPSGSALRPEQNKNLPSGTSKPWMSR